MKKILGIAFFLFISFVANSQDIKITNYQLTSSSDLAAFAKNLSANSNWSKLATLAKNQGFTTVPAKEATYGFSGEWNNLQTNKKTPARFYIVDMYNPKSTTGQGACMVYREANGQVYMALCVYPAGEKDLTKALELCTETTVDATGKLVPAKSWSRCFRRCAGSSAGAVIVDIHNQTFNVPQGCGSGCIASIAVCGGATAILAAVCPVTFPVAAITFGICAGASCGMCLAVCALGCQ